MWEKASFQEKVSATEEGSKASEGVAKARSKRGANVAESRALVAMAIVWICERRANRIVDLDKEKNVSSIVLKK